MATHLRTAAVGYIRVVAGNEAARNEGIRLQRQRIAHYCTLYQIALVDIFVDGGESTDHAGRDGLRTALEMLASTRADTLIVATLSRVARSFSDLTRIVAEHFAEESGRALVAIEEQIDTATKSGRMAFDVLAALSRGNKGARHA